MAFTATTRSGGSLQFSPLAMTLLALLLMSPPSPGEARPPSGAESVAAVPLQYSQPDCPIERSLQVKVDDTGAKGGTIITLHLMESSIDFLHSSQRSGGVENGGRKFEPSTAGSPCFYQGSVEGDGGLVVAKQRNGVISGSFHYANRAFELPEQSLDGPSNLGPLASTRLTLSKRGTCGVSGRPVDAPLIDPERVQHHRRSVDGQLQHQRSRRSLKLDTRSNYSDTARKYLELILVGDQYYYQNQSSNMVRATDRLWEIGNYVNALYKQIGVNVLIVHTETWATDPYTLHSATNPAGANSSEQLDLFMHYRMQRLSAKTHSAAHLITGLKYSGTDVGLAHLGKLCHFALGGGVNSDRDANAYGVAVTLAHELGHNLGLNHDEDERSCRCPDAQGCIMAAVGNEVNPVQFSDCSILRYLDFSVPSGLGYCMANPPTDAATVGTKVTCGNRIVEAGEECDCGPARWCNNTCCNPATCRFTTGATCASGECCNLNTCTVQSQGVVCRAVRDTTCDLPEYCNGTSEWCPEVDDYKLDGTECLSGKAYCHKGRCIDRDTRCAALFNGTGFTSAPASWSVAATQGLVSGYCSYNETNLNPLNYTYTACTTANQRCGLLYCTGGNIATSEPWPLWKGLDPPDTKVLDTTISGTRIVAAYAMHNLKYTGYRDPGMVPNGAECGTNMMCVDSQCVSTTSAVTCPNCNGRGSCAQSGLCFCQTGYRPPDCLQTGGGGSTTNRLPDSTMATTMASTTTIATAGKSSTGQWQNFAPHLQLLCLIMSLLSI